MMIIREKIGTLKDIDPVNRVIERLPLPWYESGKRILHKRTDKGREVVLKFMKENPNLSQDDVVYADDRLMIVIDIEPCEAIVLEPSSLYDMALICYEIGNKHLPLFYDNGQLLIPFDATFFRWLEKSGYSP